MSAKALLAQTHWRRAYKTPWPPAHPRLSIISLLRPFSIVHAVSSVMFVLPLVLSAAFASAMSAPSSTFSTLLLLTSLTPAFAQSLVNPTTAAPSATPLNSAFGYEYVGCWNETTGFKGNDGARALAEEGKSVGFYFASQGV